jgi:hypothetical protein
MKGKTLFYLIITHYFGFDESDWAHHRKHGLLHYINHRLLRWFSRLIDRAYCILPYKQTDFVKYRGFRLPACITILAYVFRFL